MAVRNSNIWEARLGMMEHAREHFRYKKKAHLISISIQILYFF
jgi:hypothetical protein